ncbi:putative type IV secretion system protein VirB5 [Burkholderia pseudomallei]|nr:putative type IV secretion system protein VirB5 [Burkholderia pseudomallei]CAJ5189475.1 putative type IV secretion system protein VirB5 [Burkholderia pseudomallei]CAJ5784574.1 putative type IV secretion system protein VirB5 [Burkholderia pseudomallei]CAJ6336027.1 putative type IV secretion system protein VirB5 [Burkholderia pseudomallei]CAJ6593313.1 putative type IV secretion system protein VirB5 [Burkholderia pseudomallei]
MKKTLVTLAVAASLGASVPAFATTGIPTFDAATVIQLQQQFKQLQDQYKTLKDQYAAVTGSYGRGVTGLNQSINAASVVPGSWQEVVAQQQSGAFGSKQSYYEKLINTMPQDLFANPQGQNATNYKMSTDSVRAAMAGGDSLYSEVQTHLNNLSVLSQQVDTTVNVKDAQDLQNRISTENGMLSSAMAKLNAMNMNLQANLLNQQNQATAATQKYFRRTGQ